METYQAIYDAVRSKISGGDINEAVERAFSDSGFSHHARQAMFAFTEAGIAQQEPSVLYKPKLFLDGNLYCALYGENLIDGCAGFGKTPKKAMDDFNKNWYGRE